MVSPKPPSDVPGFGRLEPSKAPEAEQQIAPDKKSFQSFMEETPKAEKSEQISPMELSQKTQMGITPTADSLLSQLNSSQLQMTDIQTKLQTPNISLKNAHQKLLNGKLSEANEHLQKAGEYLGANSIDPTKIPKNATPVTKFLGYLTDGQNQLMEAKKKLEEIQSKGGELKPSEMMLIQVNLSQAQQEIEFSSVLLSKVVEALKQTLSIQL